MPLSGRPSPIPKSVLATVLIWTYLHGTWLEQPGSDAFRHSTEPELSVGNYQPALTWTGGWLVFVGDGTSAGRDDVAGRLQKLLTRFSRHLPPLTPAAEPGHVWLVGGSREPSHCPPARSARRSHIAVRCRAD
jgi:hypothetical protein